MTARPGNLRYASKSWHSLALQYPSLRATRRHRRVHSITSSAAISRPGGTSRLSALAVLRLRTVLNRVGRSTCNSPGLAPLRILSTNVAARRNFRLCHRQAGRLHWQTQRIPPMALRCEFRIEERQSGDIPPGLARLDTIPDPTASLTVTMTIGTVVVPFFAARVAGVRCVTRASTLRWSSWLTSSGSLS